MHPRHRPQPRFFGFELYVGDRKIDVRRINFYKGLLVGGIEFIPSMGSWHSAWTQRLEPVMGLAVGIMRRDAPVTAR